MAESTLRLRIVGSASGQPCTFTESFKSQHTSATTFSSSFERMIVSNKTVWCTRHSAQSARTGKQLAHLLNYSLVGSVYLPPFDFAQRGDLCCGGVRGGATVRFEVASFDGRRISVA